MGELVEPAVALATGLLNHAVHQGRLIAFGITIGTEDETTITRTLATARR